MLRCHDLHLLISTCHRLGRRASVCADRYVLAPVDDAVAVTYAIITGKSNPRRQRRLLGKILEELSQLEEEYGKESVASIRRESKQARELKKKDQLEQRKRQSVSSKRAVAPQEHDEVQRRSFMRGSRSDSRFTVKSPNQGND